jgi:hypothetical protein
VRALDRNLVAFGGRVFERNPFDGRLRPLAIDLRPGRVGLIRGATQSDTIRQVLDHLERILPTLNGFQKQLAQMVLQRHGRNGTGAIDSFPQNGTGPGSLAQSGQANPGLEPHGQGDPSQADPGSRRPAADPGQFIGQDGQPLPAVCRDLHAAVCNGNNLSVQARNQQNRAQSVLRSFWSTLASDARTAFDRFAFTMRNLPALFNPRQPNTQGLQLVKSTFTGAMNFLKSQLTGASSTVESVRQSLLSAIGGMDFPDAAEKSYFLDQVRRVKIDYTPDPNDPSAVREYAEGCGPDGMAPTAFALPERNSVFICPGLFADAAANHQNLLDSILHVVSHEIGHTMHIPFPGAFRRLEACFGDVFGNEFHANQVAESVADTIGAYSLAEKVKGKSPAEALRTVAQSVKILCFTSGTDRSGNPEEHPSGVFRINNLIGRNPDIMKALGCGEPTEEKPACQVQGKVPAQ